MIKVARHGFKLNLVPASRPRVGKFGTYYSKTYQSFKDSMKVIVANMEFNKVESGPIHVYTRVYKQMPKSWSKKEKDKMRGTFVITNVGDNDNIEKAAWDPLNGFAWEDDCQIAWNETKATWHDEGSFYIVVSKL